MRPVQLSRRHVPHLQLSQRPRRALLLAPTVLLAATTGVLSAGTPALSAPVAATATSSGTIANMPPAQCTATYRMVSQWETGFVAAIEMTNLSSPIVNWEISWDFPTDGQRALSSWSFTLKQTGRHATISNAASNDIFTTGRTVKTGIVGMHKGTNPLPSLLRLNGNACVMLPVTSSGGPSSSPAVSPSAGSASAVSPSAPSNSAAPVREVHVDNPYLGAKGYVNPDWASRAKQETGGSRIASTPTAVWIDKAGLASSVLSSKAGLAVHLERALAQGASYIQFVLADMPGRDCDRTPTGEYGSDELEHYQENFIDEVVKAESNPRYGRLRIVNILEPRWAEMLLIGSSSAASRRNQACVDLLASGNLVQSMAYAIDRLHASGSNVYTYLDASWHGYYGWTDTLALMPDAVKAILKQTTTGYPGIDGFSVNVRQYGALHEPYFDAKTTINGNPVNRSKWVDWASYVDESSYAAALRTKLIAAGFPSGIGMVIDTSRNGWGGPKRPSGPSSAADIDTFVDHSRVDRRRSTQNWCNQDGAGLGERPTVEPEAGVDAYAWLTPPGESDGLGSPASSLRGYDPMCDPDYLPTTSSPIPTGALPNGPTVGTWFPTAFAQLMANAYPPLPE